MPRGSYPDDDWSDPSEDDDAPQSDLDAPTEPCPECGESISDDAEQCPSCGHYLSPEETPSRKPWWVILGALVCLYVIIRGLTI